MALIISQSHRVQANNKWQNTHVFLAQGVSFTLKATSDAKNNCQPWIGGPRCTPQGYRTDGQPRAYWADAIVPTAWQFSLVGRIGRNGTPFSIGNNFSGLANATGDLYLSFNDGLNFTDNNGYWDVEVRVVPQCATLSSLSGTDQIEITHTNSTLLKDWGVLLTVQCGVNEIWNQTQIDNMVSTFTRIQNRFSARIPGWSFSEVFGGVEFRHVAVLNNDSGIPIGGRTLNGYVIRIGPIGRSGGTRPPGVFGSIDTGPYGLNNPGDTGMQATITHELGHILDLRTNLKTFAGSYVLAPINGAPSGTLVIGKRWENPTNTEHEIVPDHFLNWVFWKNEDSTGYLPAYNPDDYDSNKPSTARNIAAYWIGGISPASGVNPTPGMIGWAGQANPESLTGLNAFGR